MFDKRFNQDIDKVKRMNKKNVTRKELALSVTEKLGVSQRNAAVIIDTVFATLKTTLVNGKSIKLVQFGSLNVRDKSPRLGRNPKTGESMTITKRQTSLSVRANNCEKG
jgi:integration host factor subunit alpha